MTPFLQFILLLAIIILAAKSAGYVSSRLHQPAVLGELTVGLVLGPSLFNLVHWPFFTDAGLLEEIIKDLAELGVLLLMFVAGLELHLSELHRVGKASALAGVFGVVVPLSLGIGLGLLYGMEFRPAFFLGLTMGATSVSISAQTLMELKVLRSRVGLSLLGAAVFDDVLVILLLSVFLALGTGSGSVASVIWVFVRMLLFLGVSTAFGLWILPRLVRKVSTLPISQGVLSLALVVLLAYAVSAEVFGSMAAITGAFLAGLMFGRSSEKEQLERSMHPLAYGFFVPVFFVHIGLSVDLGDLSSEILWFTLAVVVFSVLGKIAGSGWGASLAGFKPREALQLGAGMVSRGEVGLILATVGIKAGWMEPELFSTIVGMVLATTLITPPLLRYLFRTGTGELPTGSKNARREAV